MHQVVEHARAPPGEGLGLGGDLLRAGPDDLRRAGMVAGRARWLDEPSVMLDLLARYDRREGTAHARTIPPAQGSPCHILGTVHNPPTLFWQGQLAEVLCWRTALSEPQCLQVRDYLKAKYAI